MTQSVEHSSTLTALKDAGAAFTAALAASLQGATTQERAVVAEQLRESAQVIARAPTPNLRRRSVEHASTHAALLEAARRVFAEQGYGSATVADVAKAAGFTKGAVYSNFASKEELFLAAIEDLHADQRVVDAWPEQPTGAPTDSENSHEVLLSLELYLHALRNPHIRERLRPMVEQQFHDLAAAVHRSRAASGDPTQVDVDAAFVIAALQGFASIVYQVLPASFDVAGSVNRSLARLRADLQTRHEGPTMDG